MRPRLRLLLLFLGALAWASHAAETATSFDIFEFDIAGNSVLPRSIVETVVYPHLGPQRSLRDVDAARASLEQAYHKRGYLTVSVTIPEQQVTQGVVRLQVVEGSVESLKVSGNKYHSRSVIREEVPALAVGEIPHFPSLQSQLGALSRTPDRKVTPLLRPGRVPGKLEVELAVEDELPLHGSVELNNRRSPDTSPWRIEAGVRYDNLFQRSHSASVNYVVSPENRNEVEVLVGSYTLPVGGGHSLALYGLLSDSNIASAADTTVIGKGTTFGARYIVPLPGLPETPTFFHTLALGFDRKNFRETQNLLGADQKVSPLRYTSFTTQYTGGRSTDFGDFLAGMSLVTGLRRGSQRDVNCQGVVVDQFACRRFGAQSNFMYLRGELSYTRRLLGWELFGRGDFQAAGQPLVSNEQFLAGGQDSVRGYLEGEAAGDRGWRLRAEVRTPALAEAFATTLRAVVFLEGAELTLEDPLPGQRSRATLAGSGLGLRLKAPRGLSSSLEWAVALRDGPRTSSGDHRVHARLGWNF